MNKYEKISVCSKKVTVKVKIIRMTETSLVQSTESKGTCPKDLWFSHFPFIVYVESRAMCSTWDEVKPLETHETLEKLNTVELTLKASDKPCGYRICLQCLQKRFSVSIFSIIRNFPHEPPCWSGLKSRSSGSWKVFASICTFLCHCLTV